MLNSRIFYHGTTRKLVVAFGDLFNNMAIQRKDSSGNIIQQVRVPISYGPKAKWLATVERQADGVSIQLPRMAFEIVSFDYDPTRKNITTQKYRRVTGDNDTLRRAYMAVPYNVGMSLSIFSKFTDEGLQLIEQIIPFFTPDFNVSITWIPELNIKKDIPIVLNSVSPEEVFELGQDPDNRVVGWTLNFTLQAEYIGPVITQGLITKSIAHLYANTYTTLAESLTKIETTTSGELDEANSNAVTRISIVPDPLTAEATDDYGYTISYDRRQQ